MHKVAEEVEVRRELGRLRSRVFGLLCLGSNRGRIFGFGTRSCSQPVRGERRSDARGVDVRELWAMRVRVPVRMPRLALLAPEYAQGLLHDEERREADEDAQPAAIPINEQRAPKKG